ncbi:unnamed protein product [Urochloa decumbens]|uniref:Uncharacterized protein n=1 Tax=Urochloa decumbens TaxID=240449 RepID=A0ABC8W915_9POAL
MGLGDGDLKNKEASATEGGDNLATVEPSGAGKKRLVMVRVKQELIDEMIRTPFTLGPTIPQERLAKYSESFRTRYAEQRAAIERLMAYEKGILHQYYTYGYAEVADNELGGALD